MVEASDRRVTPEPFDLIMSTRIPGGLVTYAATEIVTHAMREADLHIMNSRSEGLGLVLLEAMLNRPARMT
jgi:hypothetical protein